MNYASSWIIEISSISVNDASCTFSYDKAEKSLKQIVEESNVPMEAPAHQYYNRWLHDLDTVDSKAELTVDLAPETLIARSEELGGGYEPIGIRIEYELCGSHEGLRFMKTISSDGQHYSVSFPCPVIF